MKDGERFMLAIGVVLLTGFVGHLLRLHGWYIAEDMTYFGGGILYGDLITPQPGSVKREERRPDQTE